MFFAIAKNIQESQLYGFQGLMHKSTQVPFLLYLPKWFSSHELVSHLPRDSK